jgi:cytidylate kinase
LSVITVSRGSASGGQLLAEKLAARLGYDIVSREDIVREAARFGVPEDELQEAMLRAPRFWQRFSHQRRRYLAFVQAALCERAAKDRLVYHGNAGHFLLAGVSHVMCVRLIAPTPERVELLQRRAGMGAEEALRHVEEGDKRRQQWTRFLYGVDWLDPVLYDLTVNLKTLDIEGAVEVVVAAAGRPQFRATDESRKAMGDLVVASRVRAALASSPEIGVLPVDVTAREGVVLLKGRLHSVSQVESVLKVAGEVDGVKRIDREQLDAPNLTVC